MTVIPGVLILTSFYARFTTIRVPSTSITWIEVPAGMKSPSVTTST